MLKRMGRSLILLLVLVTVLALVGCGGSETKVSADQVVQDALAAQAGVANSHMEIDLDITAQGTLNGSPLNVSLDGEVNGDIDWANKKMQAHVGLNIEYNTMQVPMSADMYAVDNYTYMQTTLLGMTDNWTKVAMPVDFWSTQSDPQFIDSILQSTEAKYLKEEKVGSINCYVVELTPDIAAIQQMLAQQSSSEDELPNVADLIGDLSFKVWVAKDTSFVTKIEMALSAHLTPEALGETANGDVLNITLTISVQATEFNESVSIELPDEAQNATEGGFELPLDMFGM